MRRVSTVLCAAAVIAAAAYYALAVIQPGAEQGAGLAAFDIYAYFYPNARYAVESLQRGTGLLWNPYQNCGQPFFAFSVAGLLYPVNLVFAVLPREPALLASIVLNLSIAGAGAWWLGREMGWSASSALAAALAFELGGTALMMASWSPMHIGAYAWMPAALAGVERLLRLPTARSAILLGVVLTLQLLPGFPQINLFTYQVIAMRVVWQFATARVPGPAGVLALLGLGMILPVLLAAVQLWPSLEVARDSVRTLPLRPVEIGAGVDLATFQTTRGGRFFYPGMILTPALASVALLGLLHAATRRLAIFYVLVCILYVALAVGDATPLLALYQRLPMGSAFRGPDRFVWVTSFALAMLAGLGVEAVTRGDQRHRGLALVASVAAVAAGSGLFWWVSPDGVTEAEIGMLAAVAAAVAVAGAWSRRPLLALAGLVVAQVLGGNGLLVGATPLLNHRVGDIYGGEAAVLASVRGMLTPNDRVFLIGKQVGMDVDWALIAKSATLFRLPAIFDYEPQAALRYAQYFTYMRLGRPMTSVYDWYRFYEGLMPPTFNRRLFDLTAARYIVVHRDVDRTREVLRDSVRLLFEAGTLRVYTNPSALPRAFYVPSLARVPDALVLPMLAEGRVDPRALALVGVADATAWTGGGGDGTGTASIVGNEPQDVTVAVSADAPGYLYLADQYAPGWSAQVNGTTTEILRANHAFRLVAVPAGRSQVVFRYRPLSLRVGGLVSLATALLIVLVWVRSRPHAAPSPPGPSPL